MLYKLFLNIENSGKQTNSKIEGSGGKRGRPTLSWIDSIKDVRGMRLQVRSEGLLRSGHYEHHSFRESPRVRGDSTSCNTHPTHSMKL